ncbi:MAG: hypothetical protein JSR82_06615 [Verrucomicrobia bacterium]|nr:hypothetical protein [Verrucomicrobiota bacterium]
MAELLAFAQNWETRRRELLEQVIDRLLVVHIGHERIHARWAELYSHAKAHGLAIQHDHNDVWIAATAQVAGLRLLSTDGKAFLPLRGTPWLDVVVLDPRSAHRVDRAIGTPAAGILGSQRPPGGMEDRARPGCPPPAPPVRK